MYEEGCNKADCIYRSTNYGLLITCDYLLITNQCRNCGISDDCDKYTPGEKTKRKWMDSLYKVNGIYR